LEFSLARSPLDLLLQPGLTLFIWLGFNFVSLLDQSCINLIFLCTKMSLTWSNEVSLSCTFLSCPVSLPEFLPSWVTPCPIYFLRAYPDSYLRLCPIPYLSCYPKPNLSCYLSHTRACYPKLYPSRYLSRTRACYPELYPSRYLIALPGRVTPYRLCPRTFTQAGNLPPWSLVDPTLSLSAKFGLHLTRPTTHFSLYRRLT
jgi:hypothetical protein